MSTVNRTIRLKKVHYFTNKKNFSPAPIDVVLRKVLKKLKDSESRHFPKIKDVKDDNICHFVNKTNGMTSNSAFLSLQVCTYIHGYVPAQFVRDFSESELSISTDPIVGKDGKQREVVFISHVIAKGEVLAVQLPKGSGGIAELEQYLTWLIRNSGLNEYKDYPHVHLIDVLGKDFEQTLKSGGGAEEMTINMATTGSQKKGLFSGPLQGLAREIGGTDRVSIVLKGRNKLDNNDVINLYNNNGDFDGVIIRLKRGGVITTGSYKVKSVVTVDSDNGNPRFNAMTNSLSEFIKEQMKFQNIGNKKVRLIDDNGNFV